MRTTPTRRLMSSPLNDDTTAATSLLPIGLFVLVLSLNLYGIRWGLPNGNETWANDAIQPGAAEVARLRW